MNYLSLFKLLAGVALWHPHQKITLQVIAFAFGSPPALDGKHLLV